MGGRVELAPAGSAAATMPGPRAWLTSATARACLLALAMGGLALVRAQIALAGVVDGLALGAAYGLAWLGLAAVAGWRPVRRTGELPTGQLRAAGLGLAGGLLLVAASLAFRHPGPLLVAHAAPFAPWAAVTILVAGAEEVVLRGAFFAALGPVVGPFGVALLAALAFALIHVPLEGWSIVPLDVGAGLWLGGLRLLSGGVTAPAAAHVVADLATWWL